MKGFTLHIQSAELEETFENVVSFVGADATGSFGIQAGHEKFLSVLGFGLTRFRYGDGDWQYVAMPGGILRFHDDVLSIATRRYVRGEDYRKVSSAIDEVLASEEASLRDLKASLARLEQEMTRRMLRLQRGGDAPHV